MICQNFQNLQPKMQTRNFFANFLASHSVMWLTALIQSFSAHNNHVFPHTIFTPRQFDLCIGLCLRFLCLLTRCVWQQNPTTPTTCTHTAPTPHCYQHNLLCLLSTERLENRIIAKNGNKQANACYWSWCVPIRYRGCCCTPWCLSFKRNNKTRPTASNANTRCAIVNMRACVCARVRAGVICYVCTAADLFALCRPILRASALLHTLQSLMLYHKPFTH